MYKDAPLEMGGGGGGGGESFNQSEERRGVEKIHMHLTV